MIKKLRIKFVGIFMTLLCLMLCIIFCLVYTSTKNELEQESISMLKSIAADPFQLGQPNESGSSLKLPYFALQIGTRGELIATGGGYYDLSDLDMLQDLIVESLSSQKEYGVVEEYQLRYCRTVNRMGTVLVFADMSSEKTTLHNLLKSFAAIGLVSFVAFLGISVLLSRWAVQPVDRAWTQQRQFIGDASHELKTPLTVIMTNAELLQSPDYDDETRSQFSQSILTMSRQMRFLVERMLELARSDDQQNQLHLSPVDLSRLVQDSALSFEGVFFEKGLSISQEIEPSVVVRGNSQGLQQVLDILLDNAQKYAAGEGAVKLRLYSSGHGKCRISLSNPAQDLSQEDLQNIFRRFYRMDQARSRDGSFGLGLPIAKNIVEQHHGRIWAESGGGTVTFTVELHKI